MRERGRPDGGSPGRSGAGGLLLGVALLLAVTLVATGAVWTNTLGAGDRFSGLVARARMIVAPPPDREIEEAIYVEESFAPPTSTPAPVATRRPSSRSGGIDTADTGILSTPEPTVRPTPAPVRRRVDFQLRWAGDGEFASQVDTTMCASAAVQIVLAIHGVAGTSPALQNAIDGRLGEWESRRDAKAGGWGPNAIREALEAYGVPGYKVRLYRNRESALRDSARIVTALNAPVIIIAWRGAHAWVMTGYRADADPTIFRDADVTGAYVFDPWYPRVSSIWGPSDPPGTFQDADEMRRNFLPWQRPEGAYPERDGLFITVAPTVPMGDVRGS